MYAKLVMSSEPSGLNNVCRDVVRLITSNSPSTSLLSSNTWNVNACSIVDSTPAGWTYVGSNVSGEDVSLGAVNSGIAPTQDTAGYIWVVKSACASPNASKDKYAILSSVRTYVSGSGYGQYAALTMCQSSTSSGTTTNETNRPWYSYGGGGSQSFSYGWGFKGTGTYHVIANQRHITIIKESSMIQAVWEHSSTDLHLRYSQTPAIQFSWSYNTLASGPSWGYGGTGAYNTVGYPPQNDGAWLVNITDVNSGTTYGVHQLGAGVNTAYSNGVSQPYLWPNLNKVTTISSTGTARQLVSPIMFQLFAYGYPTMYVTGVVPIYMCKGGIGSAGDSINVNGTDYIFIPVNSTLGIAIQSS